MKVFIDLEGTIIDEWGVNNFLIKNAEQVKETVQHLLIDELNIFSFAVLNEADKELFRRELQPQIEKFFALRVKVWSKNEIMDAVLKRKNLNNISEFDFYSIFGKGWAFIEFCQALWTEGSFLLFDDAVENTIFQKDRLFIELRKI